MQGKQLNIPLLKMQPAIRVIAQTDVDKAKNFVAAVKLVEDTFDSCHNGSLAATEVLKILGLESKT